MRRLGLQSSHFRSIFFNICIFLTHIFLVFHNVRVFFNENFIVVIFKDSLLKSSTSPF